MPGTLAVFSRRSISTYPEAAPAIVLTLIPQRPPQRVYFFVGKAAGCPVVYFVEITFPDGEAISVVEKFRL